MSSVKKYIQSKFTRNTYFLMVIMLAVLLIIVFPLNAEADQVIEVVPQQHDFGDVQIGTYSTAIITIQNTGDQILIVSEVSIQIGYPEFQVSLSPTMPAMINPPDGIIHSVDVGVTFTPSAVGNFSGSLMVVSNDPESPIIPVSLEGTGVSGEPPPSTSIAEILAFFDASIADGTLVGDGPGNSADGRRNALRNQIEAAGDLIDAGNWPGACEQLMTVYERCDGLSRPPEFVDGPAGPILASIIFDLMAALGCE